MFMDELLEDIVTLIKAREGDPTDSDESAPPRDLWGVFQKLEHLNSVCSSITDLNIRLTDSLVK